MRVEHVDIIGVDLGYDSVKIKVRDKELVFPSLAEEEDRGVFANTSFQINKDNKDLIEEFDPQKMIIKIQPSAITGKDSEEFVTYRVGDYVLNQRSSSIAYSLSDRKYEDPEEFAKMLSGLCLLFPKAEKISISHLITGLPIKYYENHRESFRKKLTNNFEVKFENIKNEFISKKIEIKRVAVIPQGLASYYDFIMDEDGLVTTKLDGGVGIVDLGGLTIDCIAFNEGKLIKDSPISFSEGVRKRIFKRIQDSLDIDVSQDIIKKQILAGKDYIRVRNEIYDFEEIKEQALDRLARDIGLQIKNRWQSYLMIDKILITGGATVLLFDKLDQYLEGFPCEKIKGIPQFSNCRGYVKYGTSRQRKNKAKLKDRIKERKDKVSKSEKSAKGLKRYEPIADKKNKAAAKEVAAVKEEE